MKRRDHEAALRKLLEQSPGTLPLIRQIKHWNLSHAIHHEDDREVILTSYAFLEDSLKMLLTQHFGLLGSNRGKRLFNGDGAILGSLYSRLLMAETLGIISDACAADLKTISLIRNTFAHTGHYLKFDNESLIFLSNLQTISKLGTQYEIKLADGSDFMSVNLATPRAKILGFIILLWIFCSVPCHPRAFSELFAPLTSPRILTVQDLPDFDSDDQMHKILANPPRSSPQ